MLRRLSFAAAVVAVILGQMLLRPSQVHDAPERYARLPDDDLGAPAGAFADHLAAALRIDTTSARPNATEGFRAFHTWLRATYPTVFAAAAAEAVNEHSLLLSWRGADAALRPILLMSHIDVVPAGPAAAWRHGGGFSGAREGGSVWGRGALDTKVTLVALMEAAAGLLRRGFAPRRTVYLAFGHDEELGGAAGAGAIAALLKARGVELECVLDEGSEVRRAGVAVGGVPLSRRAVALVGTAEKGIQQWRLRLKAVGGHAARPPGGEGTSAAARLARVLAALEAAAMPAALVPPVTQQLLALAPTAPWAPVRAALEAAGSRAVAPVLAQALGGAGRDAAALVRTTVAVVGVRAGGGATNVLPDEAVVDLNVRTLPGDTAGDVAAFLREATRREAAFVAVERGDGYDAPPSAVAPAAGPLWDLLTRAILEAVAPPGAVVAPTLLLGKTDSVHYADLAGGRVYRFSPLVLDAADADLVHGADERVSEENVAGAARFYARYIELAAG